MENKRYFKSFLATAFENGEYANDDVIAFLLPLFKEVLNFHEEGKVAPFEKEETLFITDDRLDIDETFAHAPAQAKSKLQELFQNERSKFFEVVGSLKMDTDVESGSQTIENRLIHLNQNHPLTAPAYLPGYTCNALPWACLL